MPHYVCPVCGGTSDTPKNCETNACSLQGQPLKECSCADGQHAEVKAQSAQPQTGTQQ